jgi:hypothetical protein
MHCEMPNMHNMAQTTTGALKSIMLDFKISPDLPHVPMKEIKLSESKGEIASVHENFREGKLFRGKQTKSRRAVTVRSCFRRYELKQQQ